MAAVIVNQPDPMTSGTAAPSWAPWPAAYVGELRGEGENEKRQR